MFSQVIQILCWLARFVLTTPFTGQIISFTLQVECDPICDIDWTKDDEAINADDEMFEITEEILPEDFDNNVFMSVKSSLRMQANSSLDHAETNLTFSCQVSDPQLGDFISSSSSVFVECKSCFP